MSYALPRLGVEPLDKPDEQSSNLLRKVGEKDYISYDTYHRNDTCGDDSGQLRRIMPYLLFCTHSSSSFLNVG